MADSANNGTNVTTTVGSPEGIAVAYGSLLAMAVLPILLGSFRSVKYHKSKVSANNVSGDLSDRLTSKDAALFPFMASAVLIVLYTVFKIFSKDFINMVITGYFYFLGVLALCHLLSPVINKLIPGSIPQIQYHAKFTEEFRGTQVDFVDYTFTSYDVVSVTLCCTFGLWYLIQKHWIANNLFGMAFAINGVEMLLLNRLSTAFILLCGLFIYDIFWVFYTDVMVTVAKSFEAPIKLIFPQDIFENGISGTNFAMLGLGDVVIPGIFIALLLRFDNSLNRQKNVYFMSAFLAYIFGLTVTIFVMHIFKHAQPALLYLVPSCLTVPLTLAAIRGDLSAMLKYEDYPLSEEEGENNGGTGEAPVTVSGEDGKPSSPDAAKKKLNSSSSAIDKKKK